MGLLGKIFGSRPSNKSSGALLKEATQMKKSGDWDGAIAALRQAYKNARAEDVTYGADTYLRLPKYLYESGKADEAWSEYNRALSYGLDGEESLSDIDAVTQGQIYGSMAGQLKKEKKFYDAAVYQAASALAWDKGMLDQNRKPQIDFDSMRKTLSQTLKKHAASQEYEQFMVVVQQALANPKNHQVADLIVQLRDLKDGS